MRCAQSPWLNHSWHVALYVTARDAMREAADPDAMLLAFCQSTYEVAANLGHWDRQHLERAELCGPE